MGNNQVLRILGRMSLKKPPSLSSWSSNLFLGMQVPPSGQMTNGRPRLGHMTHSNTPIGHGLKTISWLRWERERKVSESFYSTNKVNVRPHSVRVGESLPATALYFQSPRCVDQKINQIIWALPIETVWWVMTLLTSLDQEGFGGKLLSLKLFFYL